MPRSDPRAAKALVVETALARGAAAVAVTQANPDPTARERMREAFTRGDFVTWGYADGYARAAADPEHILAGARSVICIALPYATAPPRRGRLRGRVSNYAWSQDYHRRLRALLAELAGIVDAVAGEPVTAIACDTKPIAERAFAARAGLGWIGKHTNLIAPEHGSFVFLGEIVTTLALLPDAPLRKACGSCARCVDACPTRALRGDYTIDASRCIADLTQRTDAIPRELRPLIGDWIWGCDICQEVCPPTQRAGMRGDESMGALDATVAAPPLVDLLRLRSGEFKRRYQHTAMGWRGAAVLRRNAAVALGNALDRSSVPALVASLREEPHAMVRGHAAWALGRIASPAAIDALRARRTLEFDESVRDEIEAALEPFATPVPLGTA
ncbi:MAG: tRNA epoxyqueuosine(34) reductase QueG [Vulcanimicrobiaceae bacterium]